MKIILFSDADETARTVSLSLSSRWPDCTTISAPPGSSALRLVLSESPDLVILDLGAVDGRGLDLLKEVRGSSEVPVLIMSDTSDEAVRIRGLELGADDCIGKPFSTAELLARVRSVQRRVTPVAREGERQEAQRVEGDHISIDLAAGRVYVDGREREFSATEWKLLSYLARNPGKVISNRALTANVWGLSFVENSTIKMCVRRVRLKLGDDTQSPRIIRSYRGRGYCFELPGESGPHRAAS
ncbi:MAG TPA: response regulator transcription factor [Spirochaetia bacterium]|nr:response regulator transcription factor [Spirochaetia bacterium]